MGVANNKVDSRTQLISQSWNSVATVNGIQIMKHIQNGRIGERRAVFIDPLYQLQDELNIYQMRKNNQDSLVKVYAVEQAKSKKNEGYCSQKKRVNVVTQRIPQRLSQMPQLTFPESLHLLRHTLRGFETIYKKSGPLHIHNDLIGVNEDRQVRSWVNENWSLNHPSTQFKPIVSTRTGPVFQGGPDYQCIQPHYRDEQEMVKNLLDVVEDKTEEGRFPDAFRQVLRNPSTPLNFKYLSKFVQSFISEKKIFVPNNLLKSKVQIKKTQHSNTQPTYNNIQPTHSTLLPTYNDTQPTHSSLLPTYNNIQPTHSTLLPTYNNIQPTHSSLLPTYNNIQPTHSSLLSTYNDTSTLKTTKPTIFPSTNFSIPSNDYITSNPNNTYSKTNDYSNLIGTNINTAAGTNYGGNSGGDGLYSLFKNYAVTDDIKIGTQFSNNNTFATNDSKMKVNYGQKPKIMDGIAPLKSQYTYSNTNEPLTDFNQYSKYN